MRGSRLLTKSDAWLYTIASLVGRVVWALVAFYLAAILPTNEYGRYAFVQIVAGLTSQLILGNFGNIVSSRLATLDAPNRFPVLLGSLVYGALLAALAVCLAVGTDSVALSNFGGGLVAIAGFWIFAGHLAAVQLGYLLAGGHYCRAAFVSLLQPLAYLILIFGMPTGSGETVALYAATATGLPSALVMLTERRPRASDAARIGLWRAIANDHRHSMAMNLATAPGSLVLLFVANALASQSDPIQLAIYGLANQVVGVFFFLPTTIGGLAIPHLTRAETAIRRQLVRSVSLAMIVASVACAVGFVLAAGLPFVPQLFALGKFEIALAFLLAGLATARSPQVWVNQIERRSGNEAAALLTNAAFVATTLLFSPISAMLALAARTAGATASLAISAVLARSTEQKHDA